MPPPSGFVHPCTWARETFIVHKTLKLLEEPRSLGGHGWKSPGPASFPEPPSSPLHPSGRRAPGWFEQGFSWLCRWPQALGVGCWVITPDPTPFLLMKDSGVNRRPCSPAALHCPPLDPGATRLAFERFPQGTAQRCDRAAPRACLEQGGEVPQLPALFFFPEAKDSDGILEMEALSMQIPGGLTPLPRDCFSPSTAPTRGRV